VYKVLQTSLQLENSKNTWRPVILNTDLPLDVVCAMLFGPSARALQIFESLKSPRKEFLHQSPLRRKEFLLDHIGETLSEKKCDTSQNSHVLFFLLFFGFSGHLQRACGAADHIYIFN